MLDKLKFEFDASTLVPNAQLIFKPDYQILVQSFWN